MVFEKISQEYFKDLNRNITTEYKNFQKRYNKYNKIKNQNYDVKCIDFKKYFFDDETYDLINKHLDKLNKILDKKHIENHILLGIKKSIKTSSDGGLEWDEYYKMDYKQLIDEISQKKIYLERVLNNRMTQQEYQMYQRKQNIPEKYRKRLI